MKRNSDSLQRETIDPQILPEKNHKKRKNNNSTSSQDSKPKIIKEKQPSTTKNEKSDSGSTASPLKNSKAHSSSGTSIDTFLSGLFSYDVTSRSSKTHNKSKEPDLEIIQNLNKTYDTMSKKDNELYDPNPLDFYDKKDYKQARIEAKENRDEDKLKLSELNKKIESITTGESGSEIEKASTQRFRSFNTQSYSTDFTNDLNKDSVNFRQKTEQIVRRPFPSKKRTPSRNKWIKRMEPKDPSKPLDHSNARPFKPEFPSKDDETVERSSPIRSRKKSQKRMKEKKSTNKSAESKRKDAEGGIIEKKSCGRRSLDINLLEEFKQREHEFLMKIEELSKDKSFWESKAIQNENSINELKFVNNQKESAIEELRRELIKFLAETYRSELHNHIHELRGNLRVFCRIKPYEGTSTIFYPEKLNSTNPTKLKSVEIGGPNKNKILYHFDRVFDQETTQIQIFDEISAFVQSAVDGHQVCILAYGQTGSGKTFTMEGPNLATTSSITPDSGVLPRSVQFIFEEIKRQTHKGVNISLELACLEIYNDSLTDLLTDVVKKSQEDSGEKQKENSDLNIIFLNGKVIIHNLTWKKIVDFNQLLGLISQASKSRAVQKTAWNEKSSRSHCIYRLRLIHSDGKEGLLNIVDLAGSERADLTSFSEKSAKEVNLMKKIQNEGNHINKSLTTLGRIIRLISEKKGTNLPYRECKLTRVLQDSLGGNAKTLMFINVCPSVENYAQSKESLTFSSKALL